MNDGGHDKYRRDLGAFGIAFLVVNSLIGAGIFGLPEVLHRAVGTFAPWLLLIGGVLIATVTFCFAELTRLTDRTGGPQRYVTDAFGRLAGFQVGWLFYFGRMTAQAANVTILVAYAAALWPALGEGFAKSTVIILVFAALTVINIVGIRRVITVLAVLTMLKLLPLILLLLVGAWNATSAGPLVLPQFSAVEGVALAALYAFVGFENATIPAGEARDPKRAFARALLPSLALVTAIYFGLQWAYSHSAIAGTGPDAPLAALAALFAGNAGSLLIAATVVVSVLANLAAGHTSASRMTAALADDRLLPSWFGQVSRWGTPANSIAFFAVGAVLFALSGTFVYLAVVGTLARLIVYIASIAALPVLRTSAGLPAVNGAIVLAAPVALALSIWAATQSSGDQWQLIAGFLVGGLLLYVIARRQEEPS